MCSSVHLEGIFDAAAAGRIREALAAAGPGDALAIDLRHVRELHDIAVAMLAEALRLALARVAVLGLTQHQIRMLRYLGIDPTGRDRGPAEPVHSIQPEASPRGGRPRAGPAPNEAGAGG